VSAATFTRQLGAAIADMLKQRADRAMRKDLRARQQGREVFEMERIAGDRAAYMLQHHQQVIAAQARLLEACLCIDQRARRSAGATTIVPTSDIERMRAAIALLPEGDA
jgi:hypothetical protein